MRNCAWAGIREQRYLAFSLEEAQACGQIGVETQAGSLTLLLESVASRNLELYYRTSKKCIVQLVDHINFPLARPPILVQGCVTQSSNYYAGSARSKQLFLWIRLPITCSSRILSVYIAVMSALLFTLNFMGKPLTATPILHGPGSCWSASYP